MLSSRDHAHEIHYLFVILFKYFSNVTEFKFDLVYLKGFTSNRKLYHDLY